MGMWSILLVPDRKQEAGDTSKDGVVATAEKGTQAASMGPPSPFSPQQLPSHRGTTAANGAEVMAKAWLWWLEMRRWEALQVRRGGTGWRRRRGPREGRGSMSIITGPHSTGATCGSLMGDASRAQGV